VLGCGAIGGTVAACLARDGHDVLVSDPDPAVVAAVRSGGLRIEGPAGGFTVAIPAAAPDDLPVRLAGPVLGGVRARDMPAAVPPPAEPCWALPPRGAAPRGPPARGGCPPPRTPRGPPARGGCPPPRTPRAPPGSRSAGTSSAACSPAWPRTRCWRSPASATG